MRKRPWPFALLALVLVFLGVLFLAGVLPVEHAQADETYPYYNDSDENTINEAEGENDKEQKKTHYTYSKVGVEMDCLTVEDTEATDDTAAWSETYCKSNVFGRECISLFATGGNGITCDFSRKVEFGGEDDL